ncbi:putative sulfur controller 2 protein [Eutypa lata UCREL1]|uniref:Putative sulfur controller 2 protein n=1 Tax=Eutypa lata (strain UCR-EL1) TaxID=1287681 RepID=M7T7Q2_EUTLA|nr:putative sulfur controller 2 protein [Eutypa lata UCREL1]
MDGYHPRQQSFSLQTAEGSNAKPSGDNCDSKRPEEVEDTSRLSNVSQQVIDQTVTPFLREHIPASYALVGKLGLPNVEEKPPNSKYCYRHQPDSKCHRAADASKMAFIQSELETLPDGDRQAITLVWSLFSAAPTKHRDLMLQGIITQCCFPQLSMVSREVHEQLKIDFLVALPTELSMKILRYLDCTSLCKAAQVSRRWNILSSDDVVWHWICEQHIGRKCEKCQWGLPKLETKRLKEWKIQHQADIDITRRAVTASLNPGTSSHGLSTLTISKPSDDCTIKLWDLDSQSCIKTYEGHTGEVPQVLLLPDDFKFEDEHTREADTAPTSSQQNDTFIVDLSSHLNPQYDDKREAYGPTFINDPERQLPPRYFLTASLDLTMRLWDSASGQSPRCFWGHVEGIWGLAGDTFRYVTGANDATVKVWDPRTGRCEHSDDQFCRS